MNKMKITAISAVFALGLAATGCDAVKDQINKQLDSRFGLENANEIQFISDNAVLGSALGNLDQAAFPWVFGNMLFWAENAGVSTPVIFDVDNPPELAVDLKIEVASDSRGPITIYEKNDHDLDILNISEFLGSGVPTDIAGKTVYPAYFLITLSDFAWSDATSGVLDDIKAGINNKSAGDVTTALTGASDAVPVPFQCETVKISVDYNSGQATGEKYLLADAASVGALLSAMSDAGAGVIDPYLGGAFSLTDLASVLESLTSDSCDGQEPNEDLFSGN